DLVPLTRVGSCHSSAVKVTHRSDRYRSIEASVARKPCGKRRGLRPPSLRRIQRAGVPARRRILHGSRASVKQYGHLREHDSHTPMYGPSMSDDRAYVQDNTRQRERLRALIERLDDEALSLPVNEYWTVAGVLGHLAYW